MSATQTTNLGLNKPDRQDYVSVVSDINQNMDRIDSSVGNIITPVFSPSTAYSVGDYVIYNRELYRFTTAHPAGSWNSSHVAKTNFAQESNSLKSAITDITGNTEITGWSENRRYIRLADTTCNINSPTSATSGNVHYVVLSATEGDRFTVTATGGSAARAYAFVKSDGSTILEKAASGENLSQKVLTAPANSAYLVINDNSDPVHVSYIGKLADKRITDNENNIQYLQTIADSVEEYSDMIVVHKSTNLCNPATISVGKLGSDGTSLSGDTNATCDYIPVVPGQSVQVYRRENPATTVTRIYHTAFCSYNASKEKISYSDSASNNPVTISDGVAFVRFSFDATYTEPFIAADFTGTEYEAYYETYVTCNSDFLTNASRTIMANMPMRGKKIVNFGDSIFGNFRGETSGSTSESISHMVAMMTGATCYNVAFGGTHAKTMTGTDRAPMDFQSLVTAIIADSWTDQEAYATQQGTDYLARVQALEAIDFSKVDVITVSYGTNDWSSQVTPAQYEAALTDGISRMLTAFPNLVCVICTPMIRFKHSDDTGDDDAEDSGGESEGTGDIISSDTIESSSGYKLPEYAAKVETVGHAIHCPVCENYWTLGINLQNYSTFMGGMAAADLVHPNAKGRRLIANHLAEALNRL